MYCIMKLVCGHRVMALLVLLSWLSVARVVGAAATQEPAQEQLGTFLYFAYGSNLLADRIHINNPSAQFVGTAVLKDHRLDFITQGTYWRGAAATIVPDAEHAVWGVLWRLDVADRASLDRQELVDTGLYVAKLITVKTEYGEELVARTYEQSNSPPKLAEFELLPVERRPSSTYLKVILKGAVESKLPEYYIRYLFSIPHNGRDASPEVLKRVGDLRSVLLYPSRLSV